MDMLEKLSEAIKKLAPHFNEDQIQDYMSYFLVTGGNLSQYKAYCDEKWPNPTLHED